MDRCLGTSPRSSPGGRGGAGQQEREATGRRRGCQGGSLITGLTVLISHRAGHGSASGHPPTAGALTPRSPPPQGPQEIHRRQEPGTCDGVEAAGSAGSPGGGVESQQRMCGLEGRPPTRDTKPPGLGCDVPVTSSGRAINTSRAHAPLLGGRRVPPGLKAVWGGGGPGTLFSPCWRSCGQRPGWPGRGPEPGWGCTGCRPWDFRSEQEGTWPV